MSSLRAGYFDILRGYAFFAGAHAAPAPRARQGGILLLVCPRFMACAPLDSCGAILRPLPPFLAKEALVLRHGCRIRGKFPPEPPRCRLAPLLSRPSLRWGSIRVLQSADGLNGCGWGEVCSLQAGYLQTGCEPLRGERAVRMRMNCATQSGATAASASAADERRTSRRAFTTPGCKGECKLY